MLRDPRDGDGDGMYTATPGGKDETPVSGGETAVAEKPEGDLQQRLAGLQARAAKPEMAEAEAEAFRRDAEQLRREVKSSEEANTEGDASRALVDEFESVDWEERGREHASAFRDEIVEAGGWSEQLNPYEDAIGNESDATAEAAAYRDADLDADGQYDRHARLETAEAEFNRGFAEVESGLLAKAKPNEIFGRDVDDDDLKKLTGSPKDSKVTIGGKEGLTVEIESDEHGGLSMRRTFGKDEDGPYVVNDYFRIGETGTGAGTRILNDQINALRDEGFVRMEANCYRDDAKGFNGYYTWARLGYDGDIPRNVARRMPESLSSAGRISDLMKSPEGRAFWKQEGTSFDGVFTITPGRSSLSERVFDAYYEARRAR